LAIFTTTTFMNSLTVFSENEVGGTLQGRWLIPSYWRATCQINMLYLKSVIVWQ